MRPHICGVALLAVAAATAGCSRERSPATRLTIAIDRGSSVSAYRLTCDPPRGTIRDPAETCRDLARWPELLADGPGIWHPCGPATAEATKEIRVRGTYRGYHVDVLFSDTPCGSVPGQDGALAEWSGLLAHAGPVRRERQSGPDRTLPYRPNRRHPCQRYRRNQEKTRLLRLREAADRTRLDRVALSHICDWSPVGGRPYVDTAEVYTTSQQKAERALGDEPACPEGPVRAGIENEACPDGSVFLAVYHLTYRDYAGRWHRARDGAYVIVLDAKTLGPVTEGPGPVDVRALRRPVALDF